MVRKDEAAAMDEIRSVPLFSGLKEKQLKSVLAAGKQRNFGQGDVIVSERDMGVGFYLILGGEVEVRKRGRVLAKLGKGDFFGEMSLLDNNPRSSDVIAVAPTTCLVLSSWNFQGILKANNEIAMNLLRTLVQRLRESDKPLSD